MTVTEIIWFAITLGVGFAFGLLLLRTRIPMGGIIGAMAGVSILNLITGNATFPNFARVILMIMAGAMIGSKIGREELRSARKLLLAVAMVITVMVVFNLVLGGAIYVFSDLDVATSLFAVMPGGGTEMAIVAEEMGANPAFVGILQIVRGILFLLIAPSIFSFIILRLEKNGTTKYKTRSRAVNPTRTENSVEATGSALNRKREEKALFQYGKKDFMRLAGLFASAAAGGLLFSALEISAGLLIGGVLFGIFYSLIFGKAVYPEKLLPIQQIMAGAYLGLSVNQETLASMNELIVPIVIMMLGIILFSLLSGYIMCKLSKMDLATSFLAASPCGVAELALVSEELGAETATVAIIQTMRFVIVVSTFPLMLGLVVNLIR